MTETTYWRGNKLHLAIYVIILPSHAPEQNGTVFCERWLRWRRCLVAEVH